MTFAGPVGTGGGERRDERLGRLLRHRVLDLVDLVELRLGPEGVGQVPADHQRQGEARHQDAEELADQELPAVHRLAHQRHGGPAPRSPR
jgi:hypothetical protein